MARGSVPARAPGLISSPRQKHSDFSEEYANSEVAIELHNGRTLTGRVVESRRYWIKLTADGSTYYINKAWVVSVRPKPRG